MSHPLDHPRKRIARAVTHLEAIKEEAGVFLAREPYLITRQRDPEAGKTSWRVSVREDPPLSLSFRVGECIHNLRSSLDNLIWNFALRNSSTPPDNTAFVIVRSPQAFVSQGGKLSGVEQDVRDAVESLQPYQRTNEPETDKLWRLDRLWNDDKHRAPVIVGAVPRGLGFSFAEGLPAEFMGEFTATVGAFDDGDEVASHQFPANAPPSLNFTAQPEMDFTPDVAFSKTGPGRGAFLVQGLHELHDFVRDEVFPRFASL